MRQTHPGQVWWVDLEPATGHEQGGRRPAVVVGSELHCSFPIGMILIAPCTTADRGLPHHVELEWRAVGLDRPTWVRTEDVRAVSDRQLQGQRPLGSVTDADLMTVKRFLRLMLDL